MDRAQKARQQWETELGGLDYLPMEIFGRLSEASLLFRRDWLEPLLAEHGVQSGEFDVLATLRRAGAPYALTPTELFEAAMISSGGMTSRLDRLERSGWIKRAPNPNDRRGTIVSLTEAGKSLVDTIVPAHLANEAKALSLLSDTQMQRLNILMARLIESLQKPHEGDDGAA
ncbi:MarR family winged helix-turn-helix transcriptional regulator [Pseudoruegeria sp. SHC-113]|uniref:MarR family winged helix-turn-helix transcriptional regulator n=1 Tax=Pseudoruegeria sp. SHC-113 TaxID=2855439 RepID=UPI0021BA9252|nr:MarR family transcriptional regulator [Pseudoruegeria sp. SHC-113]MCT8160948.1 MarR family transcriptional regulator [Pseudoruegeria sp. SHC-113]